MTMPFDPTLRTPLADDAGRRPPAPDTRDIVPPNERGEDPARSEYTTALASGESRPLTDEEREAAEGDHVPGERVYAPASERVPKPPAPGHEAIVGHIDPTTPERQAASASTGSSRMDPSGMGSPAWTNPADRQPPSWQSPSSYVSSGHAAHEESGSPPRNRLVWSIAGLSTAALAGSTIGGWLYAQRRRRERNKPINRVKRAAATLGSRVGDRLPDLPDRDQIAEYLPSGLPADRRTGGAGALLLVLAPILIRAVRSRLERDERPGPMDRVRGAADSGRVRAEDLNVPGWVKLKLGDMSMPSRGRMAALPREMAGRAAERMPDTPAPRTAGIGLGGLLGLAVAAYLAWRALRSRGSEPDSYPYVPQPRTGSSSGTGTGVDGTPTYGFRSAGAAD